MQNDTHALHVECQWWPLMKALPDGWKLAQGHGLVTHHNRYCILIERDYENEPTRPSDHQRV